MIPTLSHLYTSFVGRLLFDGDAVLARITFWIDTQTSNDVVRYCLLENFSKDDIFTYFKRKAVVPILRYLFFAEIEFGCIEADVTVFL